MPLPAWKSPSVARARRKPEPTVQDTLREYLRICLGGRTESWLAAEIGITRNAVNMILNGHKQVQTDHLARLAEKWKILPHRMFDDIQQVARNLEQDRPPSEKVGGYVHEEPTATEAPREPKKGPRGRA